MTQENKELLLKDLCARLPYGVKVRYSSTKEFITCNLQSVNPIYNIVDLWSKKGCFNPVHISKIKPYLFPLSSITEEQSRIYHELIKGMFGTSALINIEEFVDWCNKNHFDYRGLIPKGLALDATGLNIY